VAVSNLARGKKANFGAIPIVASAQGFGLQAAESAKGIGAIPGLAWKGAKAAKNHPLDAAKGALIVSNPALLTAYLASHPATAKKVGAFAVKSGAAMGADIAADIKAGRYERAVGRIGFEVASVAVGGKGAPEAVSGAAKAASGAARVGSKATAAVKKSVAATKTVKTAKQPTEDFITAGDARWAKRNPDVIKHVLHGDEYGGKHVAKGGGSATVEVNGKPATVHVTPSGPRTPGKSWRADVKIVDARGNTIREKGSTMFPAEWSNAEAARAIRQASVMAKRQRLLTEKNGQFVAKIDVAGQKVEVHFADAAGTRPLSAFPVKKNAAFEADPFAHLKAVAQPKVADTALLDRIGKPAGVDINRVHEQPYANPGRLEIQRFNGENEFRFDRLDTSKKYLYIVDNNGDLVVAPEVDLYLKPDFARTITPNSNPARPTKHADLAELAAGGTERGRARAGGEISYDKHQGEWFVDNNSSYTFRRLDGNLLDIDSLRAVRELMRKLGANVDGVHMFDVVNKRFA
jgi:hypothetical protein